MSVVPTPSTSTKIPLVLSKAQWDFYFTEAKEAFFLAGVGCGKTYIGAQWLWKEAWHQPNELLWMIAPSYKMTEEQERKFFEVCPEEIIGDIKPSKRQIELKNRAIIEIRTADDYTRLKGPKIKGAWFDEINEGDELAYDEVLRRLAHKRGKLRCTGTIPKTAMGHWLYKLYSSKYNNGKHYAFQHATSYDNPDPEANFEHYDLYKDRADEDTYRREILGLWVSAGQGRVLKDFSRERNARPLKIIPTLPLWIGQDFNRTPMWSVFYQVVGDELHIVGEMVLRSSSGFTVYDLISELQRRGYRNNDIVIDPSGAHGHVLANMASLSAEKILKDAGYTVHKSQDINTRTWQEDCANSVRSMVKTISGKTRLYIDPKAEQTIQCLERICYKGDTMLIDKDGGYDHGYDAVKYPVQFHFGLTKKTAWAA